MKQDEVGSRVLYEGIMWLESRAVTICCLKKIYKIWDRNYKNESREALILWGKLMILIYLMNTKWLYVHDNAFWGKDKDFRNGSISFMRRGRWILGATDVEVHDIIIIKDDVPDDDPVIETGKNILGFAHCCSFSFVLYFFCQNLIYHRAGYSS